MNNDTKTEKYLATATAGLEGDRELRLDVRAELRSHVEARLRDAEAEGLAGDAAEEQALKNMGPALDLAGELAAANRRRMKLRAVVRNLARWCLVPLAVAVAVLYAYRHDFIQVTLLMFDPHFPTKAASDNWQPTSLSNLNAEEALVLWGDKTRQGNAARQRAIWERWPGDKVYAHNYLTHLASQYIGGGTPAAGTPEEQFAAFAVEIERIRPLDPDNARFDYLLGGKLLAQACEFKVVPLENPSPDGKKGREEFIVKDREKLDRAMAFLRAALAKPAYHTYAEEMQRRREAIVGPPSTVLELVYLIGLRVVILLPDIAPQRDLAKASAYYGERLAMEGRPEEAELFWDAYKGMIAHTNGDSSSLIGQLIQGAHAKFAAEKVPAVYANMGRPEKAAAATAEAEALQAPVKSFCERVKTEKGKTDLFAKHASILSCLLLPAIGERVSMEELAAGRELDFVVAEQASVAAFSVLLFWCMMACLATALYHRFRRGAAAPLLLLPTLGGTLRLLGGGILLPMLVYYLFTRYLPGAGRDFNIINASPKLAAELIFLLLAVFWCLTALVDRLVRRRCLELDVPVPPPPHKTGWLVAESALFALFLLVCVCRVPGPTDSFAGMVAAAVLAGAALLLECCRWLVSLVRGWKLRNSHRLFYGTRARSLIPVCALAVILLNMAGGPFLRLEEQRLVRSDTVFSLDPVSGFTAIENRAVKRLQAETQAALKKIEHP